MTLRMVAGESSSPDARDKRARTYRLAVGDVAFDQGLEQGSCALVQHEFHCTDMARVAGAWRMGPMV